MPQGQRTQARMFFQLSGLSPTRKSGVAWSARARRKPGARTSFHHANRMFYCYSLFGLRVNARSITHRDAHHDAQDHSRSEVEPPCDEGADRAEGDGPCPRLNDVDASWSARITRAIRAHAHATRRHAPTARRADEPNGFAHDGEDEVGMVVGDVVRERSCPPRTAPCRSSRRSPARCGRWPSACRRRKCPAWGPATRGCGWCGSCPRRYS